MTDAIKSAQLLLKDDTLSPEVRSALAGMLEECSRLYAVIAVAKSALEPKPKPSGGTGRPSMLDRMSVQPTEEKKT